MDVKTFNEFFNELVNEHKCEVNNVIHYRYLNKPVVVATVDVPRDERIPSYKIVDFLKSEGIKFDYLAYDGEKRRYYAMLNKNGFERCQQ